MFNNIILIFGTVLACLIIAGYLVIYLDDTVDETIIYASILFSLFSVLCVACFIIGFGNGG